MANRIYTMVILLISKSVNKFKSNQLNNVMANDYKRLTTMYPSGEVHLGEVKRLFYTTHFCQ
jgi:hypothetical protein